jgi:hypothetical protein
MKSATVKLKNLGLGITVHDLRFAVISFRARANRACKFHGN